MDESYNSYKRPVSKNIINREYCKSKLKDELKFLIIGYAGTILLSAVAAVIFLSCGVCLFFNITSIDDPIAKGFSIFTGVISLAFGIGFVVYPVSRVIIFSERLIKLKNGRFDVAQEKVVAKGCEYVYRWRWVSYCRHIRRRQVAEYVIYFEKSGRYVDNNGERSDYNTCNEGDVFYVVTLHGKKQKPSLIYNSSVYEFQE